MLLFYGGGQCVDYLGFAGYFVSNRIIFRYSYQKSSRKENCPPKKAL